MSTRAGVAALVDQQPLPALARGRRWRARRARSPRAARPARTRWTGRSRRLLLGRPPDDAGEREQRHGEAEPGQARADPPPPPGGASGSDGGRRGRLLGRWSRSADRSRRWMMPAMAAQARTIVTGGEPAAWVRLGFALQEDGSAPVGGLRLVPGRRRAAGGGRRAGGRAARTGWRSRRRRRRSASAGEHPNGALAVDHVVAFTDDLDARSPLWSAGPERRCGACRAAARHADGLPPARPARARGRRRGPSARRCGGSSSWSPTSTRARASWGRCWATCGAAVQPGRRIATVRPEAGVPVALALHDTATPARRRCW